MGEGARTNLTRNRAGVAVVGRLFKENGRLMATEGGREGGLIGVVKLAPTLFRAMGSQLDNDNCHE